MSRYAFQIMGRGRRATFIAVALLAGFFAFSYLGRLLHMDCVGPVIYGWGCLTSPMPDTVVDASAASYRILVWVGVAGAVWVICYLASDMLLPIVAMVISKARPGWVDSSAKAPPRSYRLR